MKKLNFQQYRNYHKGYKLLIRFIIYALVLFFLIYFIQNKSQKNKEKIVPTEVQEFEVAN